MLTPSMKLISALPHALKLGLLSVAALAARPSLADIELRQLAKSGVTHPSQVLVLGSVHFFEMGKDFKPDSVKPLLAKLARYQPDVITIEAEPGEDCDLALRHPARYGKDFCNRPEEAQAATGLDIPAALAAVDQTLKTWPPTPTPAERRRLAALFMAALDPASAVAQWLQLPLAERHAGDLLNDALVRRLQDLETRADESIQIGARLAAQLGHARVHPIDDHTGDAPYTPPDLKAYLKDLNAAWQAYSQGLEEPEVQRLSQAQDLLPLYRFVNRPEHIRLLAESNIVGPMASKSAERYPQIWVGGWEVRNLRMVANIRASFAEHPGARVLTIVGASHKAWFDQWLGQIQGVTLVDALKALE